MSSDHRSRRLATAGVVLSYVALAVALTWPLATSPVGHLPMGTEPVVSVPVLNAWTVWWNADRARYGFHDYWHAPIFHPTRYAFAFSEAQPTTLVVAPLVAASGPALAYNVYLLAVLTLNGLVAFRLLRRVGLAVVSAALGGMLVETLPIVHWQLGVLQLTTLCGVLWVLDRLVALRDGAGGRERQERGDDGGSDRPPIPPSPVRVTDALLLGLAAAVCYAACNYFGLFLSALLPLAFLPLVWGRWRDWRFWLLLAASGGVAAGLSAPILWAQVVAKQEYDWKREESLLFGLSARPRDYFNPHRLNPYLPALELPQLKDPLRPLWTLGPGPVKIAVAGVGVIAGLMMRGRRRWTLFLVLFGGWAFLLSFGPVWEVVDWCCVQERTSADDPAAGWIPYRTLTAIHPGLALARSPFRFAFFVQLAIALLAANGLDGLYAASRWLTKNWRPRARLAGIAVVLTAMFGATVLMAVEVVPKKQRLYAVPSLDQSWIVWLKENTAPTDAILCLPFPMGAAVEDYERTAVFMYEQIGHRRPMVDGYSGFFPPAFLRMKSLMSGFPSDDALDELRSRSVGHIVSAAPDWTALCDRSPWLRLAFRDEDANVSIYRILPFDGEGAPPE